MVHHAEHIFLNVKYYISTGKFIWFLTGPFIFDLEANVVSFRLIKANISPVMKWCFKLRAPWHLLRLMFNDFVPFKYLGNSNHKISFSFNLRKVSHVSNVQTRKIKTLFLLNFLSNTIFFKALVPTISYYSARHFGFYFLH